jgi:hypothetical protein
MSGVGAWVASAVTLAKRFVGPVVVPDVFLNGGVVGRVVPVPDLGAHLREFAGGLGLRAGVPRAASLGGYRGPGTMMLATHQPSSLDF